MPLTERPIRLSPRLGSAALLAIAGFCVFHFAGNATRGYLDTPSLFIWAGAQWFSPLDDMAHGPLVVLASVWLVARAFRVTSRGEFTRGEFARASWWFAGSLLLHWLGHSVQMPRLSFLALLLFLLGMLEWTGGSAVRRRAVPGVLLLLLALSWSFVDTWGLTLRLRLAVTSAVHAILNLVGSGVARQGTLLLPAGGGEPLEVAAACAGMRSTAAMLTLAVVLGEWLGLPWLKRVLVVAGALAIVWLGNVIRVLGLVGLALAGGWASKPWLHTGWGLLVFIGEAACVFWFGNALLSVGKGQANVGGQEERAEAWKKGQATFPARWMVLAASGWALAIGGATVALARAKPLADSTTPPPPLPYFLGSRWSSVDAPLNAVERTVMPAGTKWDRRIYFDRTAPSVQALVTVVWAQGDRTSIHRPELCLSGMGWQVTGRRVLGSGEGIEATELTLSRADGAALGGTMIYWFSGEDRVRSTYSGMLWTWVADGLSGGKRTKWAYYAVQTLAAPETREGDGIGREVAKAVCELHGTTGEYKPENPGAEPIEEGLKF
ncbi:MAG: exosortase/archaeosortase family protein [Opitutaceae bacterium]|nr:exosortase/archaeosortase family protein [Opitutaceae bacterium]